MEKDIINHLRGAIVVHQSPFEDLESLELQNDYDEVLKSKLCYAGKGYAMALASFNTSKSIEYLKRYLDYYLTREDLTFDQDSVLSALKWIDKKGNANHAEKYIPLFKKWSKNKMLKLDSSFRDFEKQMIKIEKIQKQSSAI